MCIWKVMILLQNLPLRFETLMERKPLYSRAIQMGAITSCHTINMCVHIWMQFKHDIKN